MQSHPQILNTTSFASNCYEIHTYRPTHITINHQFLKKICIVQPQQYASNSKKRNLILESTPYHRQMCNKLPQQLIVNFHNLLTPWMNNEETPSPTLQHNYVSTNKIKNVMHLHLIPPSEPTRTLLYSNTYVTSAKLDKCERERIS